MTSLLEDASIALGEADDDESLVMVGSLNPVKIQAVTSAVKRMSLRASVTGRGAPSGVSDQPMTAGETLRGSHRRAWHAVESAGADYGVGLEGGLTKVSGEWFCIGFTTVVTGSGLMRSAMSPGVWVPPEIMDLIHAGMELGDAEDKYYRVEGSKQSGGLIGIITGGLILREETFCLPAVTAFCSLDYETRARPRRIHG